MAASILDLIKNQVAAQAGNVEIPAQAKNTVLNGLTDSIFGSLTQTVAKPGGVDLIKNLLTGKTAAASSPITALAGNMFNANILKKLNLGSLLNGKLAALVPAVMGGSCIAHVACHAVITWLSCTTHLADHAMIM